MGTQTNGARRRYRISVGPNLHRTITNPREEAILDVLGGPPTAGRLLKMTRQAVHQILTVERIKDVESAERLAQATREAGREVPAIELLGLAPWRGPERHDDEPPKNGRSRRQRTVPRPVASDAGLRVAPAPAQTGTKGLAATDPPALHALRALGIVRPAGVPSRLLAAHAQQAKEKRNPPSVEVTCTSLSNPVFSNDLSVQALAFDLAA